MELIKIRNFRNLMRILRLTFVIIFGRMVLTRDRWTQLTPPVNITTHTTFIQSNLSVSSAILKPFFLHEQMCRRIFRCLCSCEADKASSLHRDDYEVLERQECRHGRSRSTSTRLQKLEAIPSSQLSTGLRRPWILARWSRHGEWRLRWSLPQERIHERVAEQTVALPVFR